MVHNPCLGQVDVEHAGENDEVQLVGVVLEVVDQVGHDVAHEVSRYLVALPVRHYAVPSVSLGDLRLQLLVH